MKLSKIVCASLIGFYSFNFALAQDNKELAEVTITGEKLEKSLHETTTSVQVFNDVDFENSSNLNDMYDLFEQSSNVNRSGRYSFNIRGVNATGVTGFYIGPKTIDITVDGVSQGTNAAKQDAISTWDVQQVEILKGPQSTIQGRGSLAGSVVVKTKDPEFEANGAAQVGYGSFNEKQISAMQTGPITENLAFRLSVDHKQTDGIVTHDTIRGDKFNQRDITNVRGKLLYELGHDARALFTSSYMKYDDQGSAVVEGHAYDRKSAWNTDGHYNTDAQSHALDIDIPFNDQWSMKSLSSFAKETFDRFSDLDYTAGNGVAQIDRMNDSITQEFKFTHKGENSSSIFGLYYSEGNGEDDQDAKNVDGNFLFSGLELAYQQDKNEDYKNGALFFNTDYFLTDSWTLIFGARLDKDKRDSSNKIAAQRTSNHGAVVNGNIDTTLAGLGNGNISSNTDTTNFLPKLGFNYKFTEDMNAGFVFTKGYRPGGVSANPIAVEAKTFDAEFTNNYEISFRSLWLDKKLSFNANIFYTDWKDQQVSEQGSSVSPFDVHIVNAGQSSLKGIEFETKYQLNNEINLFGNIGLVRAKFDDYVDGTNVYSGNYIVKTPKVSGNIGANYRNGEGYFLGGNMTYTGSQYGDSANKRKISAYHLVNIKAGYERDDWSIYAYVNNIFDRDYLLNNYGSSRYEVGDPRTVGVNFKYYW